MPTIEQKLDSSDTSLATAPGRAVSPIDALVAATDTEGHLSLTFAVQQFLPIIVGSVGRPGMSSADTQKVGYIVLHTESLSGLCEAVRTDIDKHPDYHMARNPRSTNVASLKLPDLKGVPDGIDRAFTAKLSNLAYRKGATEAVSQGDLQTIADRISELKQELTKRADPKAPKDSTVGAAVGIVADIIQRQQDNEGMLRAAQLVHGAVVESVFHKDGNAVSGTRISHEEEEGLTQLGQMVLTAIRRHETAAGTRKPLEGGVRLYGKGETVIENTLRRQGKRIAFLDELVKMHESLLADPVKKWNGQKERVRILAEAISEELDQVMHEEPSLALVVYERYQAFFPQLNGKPHLTPFQRDIVKACRRWNLFSPINVNINEPSYTVEGI